jgi:hypothetical protein
MPDNVTPGKRLRMSVSNISGWIGLACAQPWGIGVIKNINAASPWTDALSQKLHALWPTGIKFTHCFATKRARALLQASRTVTLFGQGGVRPDQPIIAPAPVVDIEGVPIIPTDGIQLQAKW